MYLNKYLTLFLMIIFLFLTKVFLFNFFIAQTWEKIINHDLLVGELHPLRNRKLYEIRG